MGYDVGQYVINKLSNKITEELKTAERIDYLTKRRECAVSSVINEEVKSLRNGGVWLVSDEHGDVTGYKISNINETDNSQTFSELFEIKNSNDKIVDLNNTVFTIDENLTISFPEDNLEGTFCFPVNFTQGAIQKGGNEIRTVWNGILTGAKTIYQDINRENAVDIGDLIKGNIYTMVFFYQEGSYTVILIGQSVKKATAEKAGIVKPDDDTLKVSADGTLSVEYALYTKEVKNGEKQRICPLPHSSVQEDYAGGSSTAKWGHVRIHEEKEVKNDEEVVDVPEQNVSYVPSYKEFFKTKERAWKNKKENEVNKEEIEKTRRSIQNNILVNSNFKLTPDGKNISKSGKFNYFEIECPEGGEVAFEDNNMALKQNISSYKISQFTTLSQKSPFVLGVSFESTSGLTKNDVDIIIHNEDETEILLDTTEVSEESGEKTLYVNETESVDGLKRFSISVPYGEELTRCKVEFLFRCSVNVNVKYFKAELGEPSDYNNESLDDVARKAQLFDSTSACREHSTGIKKVGENILFNPCFSINTIDFQTYSGAKILKNKYGNSQYISYSDGNYPISFDGWFIGAGTGASYSNNILEGTKTVLVEFNVQNKIVSSPWFRQYIYDCRDKFKGKKITASIKCKTESEEICLRVGLAKNDRSVVYIGDLEQDLETNGETIVETRALLKTSDFEIFSMTVSVPEETDFEDLLVEIGIPEETASNNEIEIAWVKLEEGEKATIFSYSEKDKNTDLSLNRTYLMNYQEVGVFNVVDSNTWNKKTLLLPKWYDRAPLCRYTFGNTDNLYYIDKSSVRSKSYSFDPRKGRLIFSYKGGTSNIYSYSTKGVDVGAGGCVKGFSSETWGTSFDKDPDGNAIGQSGGQRTLHFYALILNEKKVIKNDPHWSAKGGWYSLGDYFTAEAETSNNNNANFITALKQGNAESPSLFSSWSFSCETGATVYGKGKSGASYGVKAVWVGVKLSTVGNGVIRLISDDWGTDSTAEDVRQELPLIQDTNWHVYVFNDCFHRPNRNSFYPSFLKFEIAGQEKVEGYLCGGEFLN